jgi:hypothetical protein
MDKLQVGDLVRVRAFGSPQIHDKFGLVVGPLALSGATVLVGKFKYLISYEKMEIVSDNG